MNLVQCSINDEQYALKILDKGQVAKYDKVDSVMRERDNMFLLADHPNITRLEMTFQDEMSLFFLLEYVQNGTLTTLIKKLGKLPYELTKFYAAEILSALEYMRQHRIVHRDLKPENIIYDPRTSEIKLIDFGLSCEMKQDRLSD